MTGDTLPLALFINPGISETSHMIVWLPAICALGMVNSSHDRRVVIDVHFHVFDVEEIGLELRIGDFLQELAAAADLAIPFSVYKAIRDHARQGVGISCDLRFVPEPFQGQELGLQTRGTVIALREAHASQHAAAK